VSNIKHQPHELSGKPSKAAPYRPRLESRHRIALERIEAFFAKTSTGRRIWRIAQGVYRHDVDRAASAMAFDLFLAALPMLLLAGWLFGILLRDPRSLVAWSNLLDLTPTEVHDLMFRHLQRFSVGAVAPFALLTALWLASSAFQTLMVQFETASHARRRSWWQKRMIAFGCVFVALLATAFSGYVAVILAGGPAAILRFLGVADGGAGATLGSVLALLFALLTATTLLAAFYRVGVYRPGVRRRVWPGAVVTVVLGFMISVAFGYYVRELARFALFYGSLAAVAVTLAWLWLLCGVLILGAEINAELENEE